MTDRYDVVVVGAGPAGLSAALNLVRARRRVLLIDANRPRNAATLRSHGFLTRDGVSPLELRKLGRAEVEAYDEATVVQSVVDEVSPEADGWRVHGTWRGSEVAVSTRAVVIATGLREEFPSLPSLRAFYGTSVHSCVECDGYEKAGEPLALIGETDDLADRALLVASWTDDLVVFTNGVAVLTDGDRGRLASSGVRVDERPLDDLEGDRSGLTGVRLADGDVVPRTGGFVRPRWHVDLDWVDAALERDVDGFVVVDRAGRTGAAGLYAVGDVTPPGPEQLIVAAGAGAVTAAAVHRDLVGGLRTA
ncbi:NAD(P)/FAD-dependent oxidoreductase [Curtobacterium sp. Leaf261]|uniref:NAD(P)/FAD-dependent oxidoreductase n=1 Tax=Curtobacterium sp. Leaf261 TaxID=1736311 RepID=UPI00070034C8|nr:NAD(P)/FAD-dependent oxidoreductase [Curtobacterium sp. Leaf261]KQO60183.1 pyridine nucleotide-disulfide oxidoreductase [Curtobacterium sp. Leaf261]